MSKQKYLDEIAYEIEKCKICKIGKGGRAVPGEGNPNADIVFLGEAPGRKEAESGRPFIGRSGQLLRRLMQEAGIQAHEVYITSPVKYLPDYGTPTSQDIEHGKLHLNKQLEIIRPKLIVLLGRVAKEAILGKKFMKSHDGVQIVEQGKRKYFLTVHPAAALRFVKYKTVIVEDFRKLKMFLKGWE